MPPEPAQTYGRPAPNEAGRQEIIEAAAAAFMENGFDSASMDDIADRLGATKGRIYHYYRRKLDILLDIHLFYLGLNLTETTPIADGPGSAPERLRRMSHAHVMRIIDNIAFARVGLFSTIQSAAGPHREQLIRATAQSRNDYEALFVKVLDQGVAAGDFRAVDTRLVAKPLLGALNWTAVWYSPRSVGSANHDEIAGQVAAYALAGVLSE